MPFSAGLRDTSCICTYSRPSNHSKVTSGGRSVGGPWSRAGPMPNKAWEERVRMHPGLRLSKPMRTKERPHQARCVDAVARAPDEPLRQRLATGPGVASSLNRIEHHRRVVSAVRVFETRDVRRDHGIDWV